MRYFLEENLQSHCSIHLCYLWPCQVFSCITWGPTPWPTSCIHSVIDRHLKLCEMSLGSSEKTIHLARFPKTLLLARGCDGSWKPVQSLALPPVVQVFNLCTPGADSYHVSTWSVCKLASLQRLRRRRSIVSLYISSWNHSSNLLYGRKIHHHRTTSMERYLLGSWVCPVPH